VHVVLRRLTAHKPLVFSLVAVLVLAAAVPVGSALLVKPEAAKAQQGGPPGGGGLVVRTVPVGVGPITSMLGYAGAVQANQQVNIVARTSGIIQDLPVDVGSTVHRGDTLAVLDQASLPAQLLQAQAGLLSARSKLALVESGAKPEDIAAAEAHRSRLAAQLEHARAERAQLAITSPIDGVVATKHVEDLRFARLARGDTLVEIHDATSFVAEIRLPAGAPLHELAVGDEIALRPIGAPGEDIRCAVARIRDAATAPELRDPIAQLALQPDTGDLIAMTTPFATSVGRTGMVGHARLYGRRHSLAYAKLYLPLERVFRVELWGIM
jgi:multidrug efflux pump subunit AcrA (membrane-fusion protein)